MTREECIWWVNHLFEIRKEEYFNRRMMEDAKEVEEAQRMVLEALSAKDMISRAELFNKLAVINAPMEANDYKAEVYKIINEIGGHHDQV